MKKYDSYKDSGIEWLGDIPSHWEVRKMKNVLVYFKGNAFLSSDFQDSGIGVVKASNIKDFTLKNISSYISINNQKKEFDRFRLKRSDIIISTVGSKPEIKDSAVGQIAYVEYSFHNYYLNQNTVCFRLKKSDNVESFFKYLFMSTFIRENFNKSSLWIANQAYLEVDEILKISIQLPTNLEQQVIATFLDDKCGQIDKAIEIKEKQIGLLKEQRQIIIHNAVTKGIDKNVKLRDSGVEWIGDIPEHWEVKRLKNVLKINNGADYKHIQVDCGYPVIGSGGPFAYASTYIYDGEVLLLGRKGTVDKPLYFKGKFWAVDTMFYGVANSHASTKFLYYCSTTIPFDYYSTATALPSMTQADLNNHKIVKPPIQEQQQIVNYLEEHTTKIDKAVEIKAQQIEKLKEYKQSLINEVVTGKVRVS